MNREPVNIEFILKGDIEKEIDKVRLSMKRMGTEGAVSYRNMLQASNEAFNSLSKDAQLQAGALQGVILSIRQNEEAQAALKKKYEDGGISAKSYADASARLSVLQADLKATASGLSSQLQKEIEMNHQVEGSYNQKLASIKNLKEAYKELDESERNNVAIGGDMLEKIKNLEAETRKLAETMEGSSKVNATSIDGMKSKLSELQKSYSGLSEEERNNKKIGGELYKQMEAMSSGIDKAESANKGFVKTLESAPGALGSTVSGIRAMIKASLAFIATPLGAFVALLVGGFMALKTMFTRTGEGQQALAFATAAFEQVLDSLLNVVSKVGEFLFKAFTSPKEALNDLVQFMKDQVINRFEAIGKTGQAIGKIFSKDWKQGFLDLGNAIVQFNTGIEDLAQKTGAAAKESYDMGVKRGNVAAELHKLNVKELDVTTQTRKQEAEISKLRMEAKDNKADGKDRLKLIKEAQAIINSNAEAEVGIAQRRLNLTKQDLALKYGSLNDLPIEELKRLSDLEDTISGLTKKKFNEQRELLDQQNAINGQMAAQKVKKDQKTELEIFTEGLEIKKKQYELFYQLITATDKDYAKSRFTDLTADGESYLQYINGKIEALKKKSGRSAFEDTQLSTYTSVRQDLTGSASPTDALKRELEEKKKLYADDIAAYQQYLTDKKEALKGEASEEGVRMNTTLDAEISQTEASQKAHLDELLQKYQGYAAKLVSLTNDYQKEKAVLDKAGATEESQARTDAYNAAIAALQVENSDFNTVLFGNLEKLSKKAIDAAIAKANEFMSKYKDAQGNWLKDIDADTMQLLIKIQEGIAKAEEKTKSKLPDDIKKVAAGLREAADFASLFDSELGDIIGTAADVAEGVGSVVEGMLKMSSDPVGGIVAIASGLMKIVGSFKKNIEASKKIRAEYDAMLVKRNLAEIEYTSLLRERLRTTQEIGESTLTYNKRITAELEKQKSASKSQYDELFAKLQKEQYVSKTTYEHGTWFKKASTSNEYTSLMGKSFEDIEKLYSTDQLPEKTKILFEQLRKIKDEGVDINVMLAEQSEAMREAYTGTTADAVADSIVSGFENGYKSAADFANDFESMMKKAVMQALKLQVLEEPIRKWYESFAASMQAGTLEQDMAALNAAYNDIINKGSAWMDAAEKATGLSFGNADTAAQSAKAGSITTVNQETASKLEGHFVAVRVNTGRIVESVASINDRMAKQVIHLANIEKNTDELRRLETMEKVLTRMEQDGIKLKN